MRRTWTILCLTGALAITLIAWLGASAQDRRAPWPPRPVMPPDDGPPPPAAGEPPPLSDIKTIQYRPDKSGPPVGASLPYVVPGSTPGETIIVLPDPAPGFGGPANPPLRPDVPPRRLPVGDAPPALTPVGESTLTIPDRKSKPGVPVAPSAPKEDPAKTIESLLQAIQDRKSQEPKIEVPPIPDIRPPAVPKGGADTFPSTAEPRLDPLPPLPPLPKAETEETARPANKALPLPPLPPLPAQGPTSDVTPPSVPGAKTAPERADPQAPKIGQFILVKPVRRNEPGPDLFDPPRIGGDKGPPPLPTDADASLTPQLSVEKRGPYSQQVGPALAYQIVVRNVGTTPATQVRVEDEIPGAIRMTKCEPRPDQYQGDKAVWLLPTLPPGEERIIRLELQSDRPGEMASTTSVHVFASTSFRTRILPDEKGPVSADQDGPMLNPPREAPRSGVVVKTETGRAAFDPSRSFSVEARPAAPAKLGQTVMVDVTIQNRTNQPIEGLQLYAKVPAGLKHPRGTEIFADLPPLKAGESRLFKIPLTAAAAGTHALDVRVVGKSGEATTSATVEVGASSALSVSQAPVTRLALNRDGDVQIQVTNQHEKSLRNVEVLDRLPDNLEFVSASDRGLYQSVTRTVHWLIDALPPGQTKTVTIKVHPKAPGQFPHDVIARAQYLPEQKSSGTVEVEGYSNLALKIQDREDPIELGKDAVYEIRVENRGSTAATNVRLAVLMDEGMQPRGAQGALAYQVQGRTIVFAPIPRMAPGAQVTVQVATQATQPGDRRVRIQATSDQQTAPVWKEESTIAYRE